MSRQISNAFQPILERLESSKAAEILAFGKAFPCLPSKNVVLETEIAGAAASLSIILGWKGKKEWKGRCFPRISGFPTIPTFPTEAMESCRDIAPTTQTASERSVSVKLMLERNSSSATHRGTSVAMELAPRFA